MKKLIYCDLETYSEEPIKNGSHAYAAHPSAEVLLWAYAVDEAPAKVWDVTSSPMPEDLRDALREVARGERWHVWQNGQMFDTVFLHYVMPEIKLPVKTLIDTMILAYQAGLPGGLGQLSAIFRLGEDKAKDKDGARLIQLFCKPQPANRKVSRCTSKTHPEDWARFVNYARLDVEAMREIYKKLPRFNDTQYERDLQVLDAKINRRGICVDLELAKSAVRIAEENKELLAQATREATGGQVGAATQRDKLIEYIFKTYGWQIDNMRASELEKRLCDDSIPEPVKELLRLRVRSTKNSVTKYQVVIDASVNGRLRGTLQFRGASRTGRYAGRTFQPQNLPRPTIKKVWEYEQAVDAIKDGSVVWLYDNVGEALSSCVRGVIIAPSGKKLVIADYSNVEGRVLAWLAGEEWKLQAFRDFDAGKGHDLYKLTYGRTFGIKPEDVTKDQRQMGKVLELALGYQGGPGAFVTFARAYGMDLNELAKTTKATINPEYWTASFKKYDWAEQQKITQGLSRNVWTACDAVKSAWRDANKEIVGFWFDMADAAVKAISCPGQSYSVGRVTWIRKGNYLLLRLPSGRYLVYPAPEVSTDQSCDFSYCGVDQYTKKFGRIKTYGGKCCIAKGTKVLTEFGWIPIETVTPDLKVWDGEAWVKQEGAINQGYKFVIKAYGAWMTEDHEILTEGGWKSASQSKGYKRANCRLPIGYTLPRVGRKKINLGCKVHVWEGNPPACERVTQAEETWDQVVVRVHEEENNIRKDQNTRNVKNTNLGGMALNERTMRMPYGASMAQLWRTGRSCMRKVVSILRGFLCGYGTNVSQGTNAGSDQCERQLRATELPLGNGERTEQQHKENSVHSRETAVVLGRKDGDQPDNATLQARSRMPRRTLVRPTRRFAEVFDLINCGPRHRFVILAGNKPLIVHNCENATQAVACDLLMEAGLRLEKAGYQIVMSVHDEYIAEADQAKGSFEEMSRIMSELPGWANGLPLVAAGFEALRYRKD